MRDRPEQAHEAERFTEWLWVQGQVQGAALGCDWLNRLSIKPERTNQCKHNSVSVGFVDDQLELLAGAQIGRGGPRLKALPMGRPVWP